LPIIRTEVPGLLAAVEKELALLQGKTDGAIASTAKPT
jgi:hypothetical protein